MLPFSFSFFFSFLAILRGFDDVWESRNDISGANSREGPVGSRCSGAWGLMFAAISVSIMPSLIRTSVHCLCVCNNLKLELS